MYMFTYLNRGKLPLNDVDHPLDFFRCYGASSGLFTQQVHNMSGELLAGLVILLYFLVVNISNLAQLGLIVGMFNACFGVY